MSEQDANDVSSASSPQQMVPKERLDELIADKRRAQEQLDVVTHLLRQAVPSQQQPQEQESPEMLRLKEEAPAAYATIKAQEQKIKQQSAAMFSVMDNQDRMQFVQTFGDKGKKYLNQVESELQRLRAQGLHYDRGQIFVHLIGQEALQSSSSPKAQAPTIQAPAKVNESNVPSSDPKTAGTIASGSAASSTTKKTIEEMERDLENFSF
jgi:hypothetical protein